MLQHDISSPRPNVWFNLISGTKAIAQQTPSPARIATSHQGWLSQDEFNSLEEKYKPEIIKKVGDLTKSFAEDMVELIPWLPGVLLIVFVMVYRLILMFMMPPFGAL